MWHVRNLVQLLVCITTRVRHNVWLSKWGWEARKKSRQPSRPTKVWIQRGHMQQEFIMWLQLSILLYFLIFFALFDFWVMRSHDRSLITSITWLWLFFSVVQMNNDNKNQEYKIMLVAFARLSPLFFFFFLFLPVYLANLSYFQKSQNANSWQFLWYMQTYGLRRTNYNKKNLTGHKKERRKTMITCSNCVV